VRNLSRNDFDRTSGERERWLLRVNGIVTDAEATFAALKQRVADYEAR
jgi:hypothetical protein